MAVERDDGAVLLAELKREIRAQAKANRRKQQSKEELSRRITDRLASLTDYAVARAMLIYLDVHPEVQTGHFLPTVWAQNKHLVIPYCHGDQLRLFRLESLEDLAPGTLGILEPRDGLQGSAEREVPVRDIDLFVVPGVAFDRSGGRLGHGKGYFDRLLSSARPDALLVGLAFECQLFPRIPMAQHDVFLDKLITEKAVYPLPEKEGLTR